MNGLKFTTGTVVVLVAMVMQQFLGIEKTEATNIATNIMMGVGGVLALVGYVHRVIKAQAAKKAK